MADSSPSTLCPSVQGRQGVVLEPQMADSSPSTLLSVCAGPPGRGSGAADG